MADTAPDEAPDSIGSVQSNGAIKRLFALRRHSFVQDGAWVVITQIVGKGTATLLMLWLARLLSVDDFAAFSYLFATAILVSSYLAAGLPLAISRFTAEGRDERSWPDDTRIGAVLLIAVGTSLGAVILAPAYLPLLLIDDLRVSGPLLVAASLTMTWAALAQAGLYGSGEFRAAFPPALLSTLLLLATTSAALWIGSITLLIIGNILGIITPALAYTRRLYRGDVISRRHWSRWPTRAALAEVLGITLPGLGFSIIYASLNWLLIRNLIAQQESADQFNQYVIGLQWFSLALFVPLAFGQVLFPKFIQKTRSGALTTPQILMPTLLTFGMILFCAVAGTLLTPFLSLVYGTNYQFTRDFVFTILLAAALSGAVNMFGSFVMATRGMTAWLLVNLASAGAAVVYLWLFPLATAFAAARMLCLIQLTPIAISILLVVRHRSNQVKI